MYLGAEQRMGFLMVTPSAHLYSYFGPAVMCGHVTGVHVSISTPAHGTRVISARLRARAPLARSRSTRRMRSGTGGAVGAHGAARRGRRLLFDARPRRTVQQRDLVKEVGHVDGVPVVDVLADGQSDGLAEVARAEGGLRVQVQLVPPRPLRRLLQRLERAVRVAPRCEHVRPDNSSPSAARFLPNPTRESVASENKTFLAMLAQLASASSPLLLLRLSAVARFVRTRHPIAATDSGPCVSIHFDRSLRQLLSPPRRNQRLAVDPDRPLQSIREALAEMMPERVVPAVRIRHGTRLVGSDADAAALITSLADRGCEANLRLVPASDDALQLALDADWPPTPPAPVAGPRQCLSFFHFFTHPSPYPSADLPALQQTLRAALTDLGALGTVYLGAEGINAQLAVPTPAVDDLRATLASLGDPLSSVDLNLGDIADEGSALPFRKLVVRVRPQVNLGV